MRVGSVLTKTALRLLGCPLLTSFTALSSSCSALFTGFERPVSQPKMQVALYRHGEALLRCGLAFCSVAQAGVVLQRISLPLSPHCSNPTDHSSRHADHGPNLKAGHHAHGGCATVAPRRCRRPGTVAAASPAPTCQSSSDCTASGTSISESWSRRGLLTATLGVGVAAAGVLTSAPPAQAASWGASQPPAPAAPLVSAEWLKEHLGSVKLLDAAWHPGNPGEHPAPP